MPIRILDEREQETVARRHALFDRSRHAIEPPSHAELLAQSTGEMQPSRYQNAIRRLRQCEYKKPEPAKEIDAKEVIKLRRERLDQLFARPNSSTPVKLGDGCGVEMEFFAQDSWHSTLLKCAGNNKDENGDPTGVPGLRLAYDSSVSSSAYDEICHEREARLFFGYQRWSRLYQACERLRDAGAEVNRSCGLHVHIDCRDISATAANTRAKRLREALPWLRRMVPSSRLSNNYCNGSRGRYMPINTESYHKHSTVEVRLHSGTLDADKIRNWIEVVRFIALRHGQGRNRPTYLTTLDEFLAAPEPEDNIKQWVVARTNAFTPVTGTDGEESEN